MGALLENGHLFDQEGSKWEQRYGYLNSPLQATNLYELFKYCALRDIQPVLVKVKCFSSGEVSTHPLIFRGGKDGTFDSSSYEVMFGSLMTVGLSETIIVNRNGWVQIGKLLHNFMFLRGENIF